MWKSKIDMPLPPPRKKVLPPPRKSVEPATPKREVYRASEQQDLLVVDKEWEKEWQGMPEFVSKEQLPFHTVNVHFENPDAMKDFERITGQKMTEETKAMWHPKKQILKVAHLRHKST